MRGRIEPVMVWKTASLAALVLATVVLLVIYEARSSTEAAANRAEAAADPVPSVTQPVEPLVSVVGDSYTGGSAMDSGTNALWWSLIGFGEPIKFDVHAVGGSGYTAVPPASKSEQTTFEQRASEVSPSAQLVVFFGSRNDVTSEQSVQSAAAKAFAAAKARSPHARLIVIGPPWTDSNPPANIVSDRNAIEAAAKAADAVWVDPLMEKWFPTGSGLIGSDGIHPTDAGHQHLAQLIQPILLKYLPSN